MLIPHLHFRGDCEQAIALYERAFGTKADLVERNEENRIDHASMKICGQTVFLNDNDDMFGEPDISLNFPVHIIIYFETGQQLLSCYDILKSEHAQISPFEKASYSELVGNFKDQFGMLWGFMVS